MSYWCSDHQRVEVGRHNAALDLRDTQLTLMVELAQQELRSLHRRRNKLMREHRNNDPMYPEKILWIDTRQTALKELIAELGSVLRTRVLI